MIWQVSANDFVDNYAALEYESGYKVGVRRPYLNLENQIVYERPVSFLKKLSEYSAFMHLIDQRWKNVNYNYLKKDQKIAEYWIKKKKEAYLPYSNSIKVTNLIFDKIDAIIPENVEVIGFPAGWSEPQASDFKTIFETRGYQYEMQPCIDVFRAKEAGEVVTSIDGYHWNEHGHEIIANGLIKAIQNGDSKSSLE